MTFLSTERLYGLLPAIHRLRDIEQGAPLEALLRLAAGQGAAVEADIQRLLDNLFIETCDEWVVPYIGDLLGVRGLHALPSTSGFSQRARVANTLGYRRRKGTATMLEQLARDTTGWPARAVEFFQILGWNQNVHHLRPLAVRTPDLRRTNELELLNTAFDTATHTVDVRRIALDRGRHNIPDVGLFLWRLQSYFIPGGTARELAALGPGFWAFHPVADQDRPLFNRPQTETEVTHLAEEINVPGALRRRPLWDELEDRRRTLTAGGTPQGTWFAASSRVFRIYQQEVANGDFTEVSPDEIRICHLGPGATRPADHDEQDVPKPIRVGVDPVLGRLAWADGVQEPVVVKVGYAYGFSGDLGGGPYDRRDSVKEALALGTKPTWQVGVSREPVVDAPASIHPTLADAVAEWNTLPAGTVGVIAVMDSHSYVGDLSITVPEGSRLLIVAADWPVVQSEGGPKARIVGQLNPVDRRPHLLGSITVNGTAPAGSEAPGALALDGLLVEGVVAVSAASGRLGSLRVAHCTLVPVEGGLAVEAGNSQLDVQLLRTISGPLALPGSGPELSVKDCIIDTGGAGAAAITADEIAVDVQDSTVLGTVAARHLDAGNSLFTDKVKAERRQEGCVRYCFVPTGSTTGRRYRCQPELAVAKAKQAALDAGQVFEPVEEAALLARIVPAFTAEDYGHPAYAQLASSCPSELREGAEDGAEMGAFRFLLQPQREANLRASLDEYLRFGLEAGLIFST